MPAALLNGLFERPARRQTFDVLLSRLVARQGALILSSHAPTNRGELFPQSVGRQHLDLVPESKPPPRFNCLFICATNLMERLDPVVLRRFDLKIQFGYLKPDQAEKLFIRVLADFQGYTRPRRYAESVKVRLSQLSTLSPGEFATVVRQARALGTRDDAEQLLGALEAECEGRRWEANTSTDSWDKN